MTLLKNTSGPSPDSFLPFLTFVGVFFGGFFFFLWVFFFGGGWAFFGVVFFFFFFFFGFFFVFFLFYSSSFFLLCVPSFSYGSALFPSFNPLSDDVAFGFLFLCASYVLG